MLGTLGRLEAERLRRVLGKIVMDIQTSILIFDWIARLKNICKVS